jgi:hypothetical protein
MHHHESTGRMADSMQHFQLVTKKIAKALGLPFLDCGWTKVGKYGYGLNASMSRRPPTITTV